MPPKGGRINPPTLLRREDKCPPVNGGTKKLPPGPRKGCALPCPPLIAYAIRARTRPIRENLRFSPPQDGGSPFPHRKPEIKARLVPRVRQKRVRSPENRFLSAGGRGEPPTAFKRLRELFWRMLEICVFFLLAGRLFFCYIFTCVFLCPG